MISLEALPFTEECLNSIEKSSLNYWRMARITVDAAPGLGPNGASIISVIVHQKELVNDRILSSEELIQRGKGIFEGCVPDGYTVMYNAITYKA